VLSLFFDNENVVQINFSKKSNLKELAAFIKENMKVEDDKGMSSEDQTKDEL